MLKYIRERDSQGLQRISSSVMYSVHPKPVLKLVPLFGICFLRPGGTTIGFAEDGAVLESFMISDNLYNLSEVFFLCKVGLSASQFCRGFQLKGPSEVPGS